MPSAFTRLKRRIFPKRVREPVIQIVREPDHAAFVDVLRSVLGQAGRVAPEAGPLLEELRQGVTPQDLAARHLAGLDIRERYSMARDPRLAPFLTEAIRARSEQLLQFHAVDLARLEAAAGGLRGLDYYEQHKYRFLEMINAIAYLRTRREISELMEIGTIFSTKLIKDIFPDIQISTVDKYEEHEIGYEGVYRIGSTTKAHYNVDLLVDDIESLRLQPERPFDAVLLCEVIEHLLLNPRKIVTFAFNNLQSGGYFYLTTPNAFEKMKVERFIRRDFPFPAYPAHYALADAHMHHVREYGMSEMLEACASCGFEIEAFYFSACWNDDKTAGAFDNHELGNLVVVARKP